MDTSYSEKRIPQLDGIRGIAICLVVMFHYFGGDHGTAIVHDPTLLWVINRGRSGVDLFFVLSGFLIGGILLDHKIDAAFARGFYYRRFLRIFPLYYLLLALAWCSAGAPEDWLSYVLYLQNIAMALGHSAPQDLTVTWSLAVEEHFYLILPIMIAVLSIRNLVAAICFFACFSFGLRLAAVLLSHTEDVPFAFYFTFCRIDDLMLGVGAAICVRHEKLGMWLRKDSRTLYVAIAICALLLPAVSFIEHLLPGFALIFGLPVYAVFYGAFLLLAVCRPSSLAASFSRLWILRWLGVRAYSIYLFHEIVLRTVINASPLTIFSDRMIALSIIAIVAASSWVAIERPLIRLGHKASSDHKSRSLRKSLTGSSPEWR